MVFSRFEVRLGIPAGEVEVEPNDDLVELRWFDENELSKIELVLGGREFFAEAGYTDPRTNRNYSLSLIR
jgi:hypothetical protein